MSVMCRTRENYRIDKPSHYVNYSVQLVDGKPVHKPCDPVAPSLAAEYSIAMNALRNGEVPHCSRKNIDAVDLPKLVETLKEE